MPVYLAAPYLWVIAYNLSISVISKLEKPDKVTLTGRHLVRNHRAKMLIPFSIFSGLQVTFILEAFTAGYVACTFGVAWVGLVMVFYGMTNSIFSMAIGFLSSVVGRLPIIFFGFFLSLTMIMLLLFEVITPDPAAIELVITIAITWALSDSCAKTMNISIHGELFSGKSCNFNFLTLITFFIILR